MKIFSFDPHKNKKVLAGDYDYSKSTFSKKVSAKHYMIKEGGYGISEDVIKQLIQLNCEIISIITKKKIYNIEFLELINAQIKNYGHGNQRFVRIK